MVKFLNPRNEYHGTFVGVDYIENGTIVSSLVKDSILDNVSFKSGLRLDDIDDKISDLNDKIDGLSIDVYKDLGNEVETRA